ncbi:MAG: hypothetical protein JXA82_06295 [Sedimentisphaerales bacterium]|nr:hypothetical protein [Sedimentisphaerales bacterium]
MAKHVTSEGRFVIWLLLFIGFCSAVGWISTSGLLLSNYTNHRHFADMTTTLSTIGGALLTSSFYLLVAAIFLPWGFYRLRRHEDARKKDALVAASLFPSIFLFPVLMYLGIAVIMFVPFGTAHLRFVVFGPNVVQSILSPDGMKEAYVVDAPSIDGPNHHLYVRITEGKPVEVAALPEDVDFNKKIHWSPQSDVVVFQTHFALIGYRIKDGQKTEVVLGGERHWRANGTFWVDYNAAKQVASISFPQPQSFAYRLEGQSDWLVPDFTKENR